METKWILLAIVGLSILVLSHQQDCPQDVVFIVDHSGTITSSAPQNNLYQNWNLMKTFLNNLLLRMRFGSQNTRLATVTFGDNSTVAFNLNTYTTISGASNAILNLDYMNGGRSNVSGAFRTTTDVILQAANGKRSGVPSICVLVVAFPPVLDATLTATERDRLKAVCRLVILGVGDPGRLNDLRTDYQPYVNDAQTDFFTAAFLTLNNTDAVTPLINGITLLCPTTPTPSTIPTTRTTTLPPPTDCPQDVVFIVDHSGTITSSAPQNNLDQNWNLMKTFLNNLLLRMRFGLQNTRLATVTFGDNSTVAFNLNTYTTISGASNAILNLDYMNGGRSNVSGAFRTTTDVILQAANGKRSGVPSICVLVVAFPPVLDATLTATERDRLKTVCRLVILGVGDPGRLNALRTEYQPYVNNAQTDLFTAAFLTLNNTDAVTPLINGITLLCPTTPTLSTIPTTSTTTPPPPTASRMFTKTTSRCLSTWNGRSTKKAPPKRKEVKSPADRPFWHRRRNYS